VFNDRVQFLLDSYYDGIPHSYNVPDKYFRSDVYLQPGLHPSPLDSQESIEDRISSKYGLNLYDAATWEIGLALQHEHEIQDVYHRQVLFQSTTGRSISPGGTKDIRADTKDYHYGPQKILGTEISKVTLPGNSTNPNDDTNKKTQINGAYFFRMVSTCYKCKDPLIGDYAKSFIYKKPNGSNAGASGPTWDNTGIIVWNDWKPITGEQAWAAMIGPLQSLYLKHNGSVPMWSKFSEMPGEVQLALSIMPAVKAMQSDSGTMYHCPLGTIMYPADYSEAENVSNENNFSMYSGLRILNFLLLNNTMGGGDSAITAAQHDVNEVITKLEKWFETGLFFGFDGFPRLSIRPERLPGWTRNIFW